MKRTTLTRFSTALLFAATIFSAGCGKKSSDPCEGLLNEGMPTQVGLIFEDAQTGENLLITKNIDTAAVTITPKPLDLYRRGVIVKQQPNSPFNGALVFTINSSKKGDFQHQVTIEGVGDVTMTYKNEELPSTDPCKQFYISVSQPVIAGHEYAVKRSGSRIIVTVKM